MSKVQTVDKSLETLKKYNIKALIEILLKASKLLEKNPNIKEMDINPVIVSSSGALAVDARIIV